MNVLELGRASQQNQNTFLVYHGVSLERWRVEDGGSRSKEVPCPVLSHSACPVTAFSHMFSQSLTLQVVV